MFFYLFVTLTLTFDLSEDRELKMNLLALVSYASDEN